jgi:hypothetical protein
MPRSNITLGGQELKLDADADTSITVDTDDTIDVKVGGTDTVKVTGTQTDIKVSASRELNILKDSSDDALVLQSSAPDSSNNLRRIELAGEHITFSTGASSGTSATERMRLLDDGRVGVGGSPTYRFHAMDNSASFTAAVWNDGNNANRYGMIIQCGTDDASGTNDSLVFADGNGDEQGKITFSGGTVSYGAFTAHHPCILPDADNDADSQANAYPYGTLLETTSIVYKQKNGADTERGILYNAQKTQTANSKKVLGAYGGSMNGSSSKHTNMHQALVLGDGHILCNNAGGNISIGDGICSSSTAGIGQKATANPSMIIGIAQEAVTFSGSETKLVAVQYGLQQFIPWS